MVSAFLVGSTAGFVAGTLGEYLMHRWMHHGVAMKRVHGRHHLLRVGQGWLGEFIDYGRGGIGPILAFAGPLAWPLGMPTVALGFLAGAGAHVAFAAYSHQLQHEKPHLVFWMKKPVHFLHHDQKMWTTNFGISTDVWDRLFGTYQDVEWEPETFGLANSIREFVRIDWGSPPKLDRQARAAWEQEVLRRQRAEDRSRPRAA
jgi:sterol desaturase/sphingolipid hydroxylase (fatty acid hydroxylase superfamily)